MKFRMIILAVLVMVFAATSFGQSNANFLWAQGFNPNWTPLTYCDTGEHATTILAEGTVCILKKSPSPFAAPNPLTDPDAVIGHNGAAGEVWPTNEIIFNTPAGSDAPGFYATSYLFEGGTPGAFDLFYIVVCCDDGEGGCTPMLYSPRFSIPIGYAEIMVGAADPVLGFTGFQRVDCCTPPDLPCEPTLSPLYLECVPEPDVRRMCAQLCTGTELVLEMGPFAANEYPLVFILEGCEFGENGCNEECTPAIFIYDPSSWVYEEATGMWTCSVIPLTNGCVCIDWTDCKTPVGLMSFTAEPNVNGIELEFTTGAETDNAYFEILKREGAAEYELLTRLETQGNGASGHTYSYLDRNVKIDHEYSYKLVDVDVNGNRTVHEEFVVAATAVGGNVVPEGYELYVYPNPFNPTTTISFTVVEASPIQLAVYDITGRQVAMLVNSTMEAGQHDFTFDATGLPSGIYLAKLETATNSSVQKMVLMK